MFNEKADIRVKLVYARMKPVYTAGFLIYRSLGHMRPQ
jgi:hypothetical protein